MKRSLSGLALFPGLWLVALVFWHSNSNDAFSAMGVVLGCILVGVASGVLSLLFYRPRWGRLVILAYVLLPIVVAVGTWFGLQYRDHEPDPIGDASDRDWGKDNCWTDDFFQHETADGFVAIARNSICDLGFGIAIKSFYVFIRKRGEMNNRRNLAFRFDAIDEDTPPPLVLWLSPSRLRIGYAADGISVQDPGTATQARTSRRHDGRSRAGEEPYQRVRVLRLDSHQNMPPLESCSAARAQPLTTIRRRRPRLSVVLPSMLAQEMKS